MLGNCLATIRRKGFDSALPDQARQSEPPRWFSNGMNTLTKGVEWDRMMVCGLLCLLSRQLLFSY